MDIILETIADIKLPERSRWEILDLNCDMRGKYKLSEVRCVCGTVKVILTYTLKNGSSLSCGCLVKETTANNGRNSKTHGMTGTRLHNIWKGMRQRCNNPNNPAYNNYGGKGVHVCSEWETFLVFKEWAINNGYNSELTIDKIDNDGNYEHINCRWISRSENTSKSMIERDYSKIDVKSSGSFSYADVLDIEDMRTKGFSLKEIGNKYSCGEPTIHKILKGKVKYIERMKKEMGLLHD